MWWALDITARRSEELDVPNRDLPLANRDVGRYLTQHLGYREDVRGGGPVYTAPGRTPVRLPPGGQISANALRLIARENGLGSLSQAIDTVRKAPKHLGR